MTGILPAPAGVETECHGARVPHQVRPTLARRNDEAQGRPVGARLRPSPLEETLSGRLDITKNDESINSRRAGCSPRRPAATTMQGRPAERTPPRGWPQPKSRSGDDR